MNISDTLTPSAALTASPHATFSPVGLSLRKGMGFEEWKGLGSQLMGLERGVNWWVGDWLNFGAKKYGTKYAAALEATGRDPQTLMNVASVASRVPADRRRESLSWSHHKEVAALVPEEQILALDDAERNGWSVRELAEAIQRNIRGLQPPVERPYLPPAAVNELNQRIAATVADLVATVESQRVFATEIFGTPSQQGTVSRMVNAKHRPNLATLERMCEWGNIPMSAFGVHDAPLLPVGPVQRAAQSAIDALERGDVDGARAILERLATALVAEDVANLLS